MSYALYDFLLGPDRNAIKEWTLGLQKRDRARLNQKLDMLEQHGPNLLPQLLSPSGVAKILKLRITGRKVPTLRPMLCDGPINLGSEYTLLQGAIEKDRKLVPSNAAQTAKVFREALINDPTKRCPHEQVS